MASSSDAGLWNGSGVWSLRVDITCGDNRHIMYMDIERCANVPFLFLWRDFHLLLYSLEWSIFQTHPESNIVPIIE